MRYPSPVPTQRADYKSAEAKAIALWSRERDGLAYHHRIERNRVYLTACIVSHVCCVFCLQWGGREGQGGATHKKIGPSDGGQLLYRLYFNADRTCNTKEKKKLNRNKDKQSTTEAFHGRRKLSLFIFYGSGIDFLWYPKRLGLSVLIWNLCKTDPTLFLAFDTSLVVGTWQRYGHAHGGTEDIPVDPTYRHLLSSHVALSSAQRHSTVKIFCWQKGNGKFFSPRRVCRFGFSSLFYWLSLSHLCEMWMRHWLVHFRHKHFLTFGTRHVTRTALQFNRLTIEVHALNFHPFQIFCWF